MKKYKIAIVVCSQEIDVKEFDDKEEAREYYYKNKIIPGQYTRLYIDGEVVRGEKTIKGLLGGVPNKRQVRFSKIRYDYETNKYVTFDGGIINNQS